MGVFWAWISFARGRFAFAALVDRDEGRKEAQQSNRYA